MRECLIKKTGLFVSGVIFLITISCGTVSRPTSYTYPTNSNASYGQVEKDKRECREWAISQGAGSRGEGVREGAKGAGLGALLGGVLGYAIGGNTQGTLLGAGIGAGAGAIGGGVVGSEMSQEDFNEAYGTCMRARGYNVSR